MITAAAEALPLPTETEVADPVALRKARLETLRAQALVHTLAATALRVGDVCGLMRGQIQLAERNKGHLVVAMRKSLSARGPRSIRCSPSWARPRRDYKIGLCAGAQRVTDS